MNDTKYQIQLLKLEIAKIERLAEIEIDTIKQRTNLEVNKHENRIYDLKKMEGIE